MPFILFDANPQTIFQFLYDLSKSQIDEIHKATNDKVKKTLQHEFYALCLLNALFGNPYVHLIQNHKSFQGIPNIEQKMKYFKQHDFIDANSFELSKVRRNAVTEIIRFICKNEFPVIERSANQDQIYETTLNYLLNGDYSNAVKFLNKHNK